MPIKIHFVSSSSFIEYPAGLNSQIHELFLADMEHKELQVIKDQEIINFAEKNLQYFEDHGPWEDHFEKVYIEPNENSVYALRLSDQKLLNFLFVQQGGPNKTERVLYSRCTWKFSLHEILEPDFYNIKRLEQIVGDKDDSHLSTKSYKTRRSELKSLSKDCVFEFALIIPVKIQVK